MAKRILRFQTALVALFTIACILLIFGRYVKQDEKFWDSDYSTCFDKTYNDTYPLTKPISTPRGLIYRIALISDMDKAAKKEDKWIAYLLKGYLTWNPNLGTVSITWDKNSTELTTYYNSKGRGMELSELVVFNGKLYAVDDKTGIVFEIVGDKAIPWVVLPDGPGTSTKGFKGEWATVKNKKLVIGGFGKEWTNAEGAIVSFDAQWIKKITVTGEVCHISWRGNYLKLLEALHVSFPGYLTHESGVWSDIHKQWYFLPRKFSKTKYEETDDETRGTNLFFYCDENFNNVKYVTVGEVVRAHGFSSFKFIPGSKDEVVVAIKSEEVKETVASYVMAFKTNGKVIMPETKIDDIKFEGIEFI